MEGYMGKSKRARRQTVPRSRPVPQHDSADEINSAQALLDEEADTHRSGHPLFRTLIANLADAVFAHDLDGNLIMVNKAACQSVGYTEEELLQMTVADIDTDCLTRDDQRNFWLALKPNEKTMVRVRHRRRDGSEYPAEVHLNRIEIDGRPVILGVARNLTDLFRAQDCCRESQQMLLQSQRIAHTGCFRRDLRTNVVTWSDELYRIIGYEPGQIELNFDEVANHVHPEDRDRFLAANHDLVRSNKRYDGEYRLVDARGDTVWVRSRAVVERNEAGEPTHVVGAVQDITEMVSARRQREHERAMNRTMLDTSPEAMFLIRADGTIVACNKVLEKRLNLNTDRIIGTNVFEILDKDVAEFRRRYVEQVVNTRAGVTFEDRRAGLFLRHTLEPVLNAAGDVEYIAIHGADFTDIRNTETALYQKQLLLSQAEVLSNSGAFEWDILRQRLSVSEGWQRIHGVESETLAFHELVALIHPDDRLHVDKLLHDIAAGDADCSGQHRIVKKDTGEVRYIQARGVVQRDADGKPVRILGSTHDITDQHLARQALSESEDRYRTLVETAADAIIVADPDTGSIIDANKRAEELLGRTHHEIVGLHQSEIHPKEEQDWSRDLFEQAIAQQGRLFTQAYILHKDGRHIPVEISSGGVVKAGGKDIHFGIFRDISERKAAEQALAESQRFSQTIADTTPSLLYVYDVDQNCNIWINAANRELIGETGLSDAKNGDIGSLSDRIHPDDMQVLFDRLKRLLTLPDGRWAEAEYRFRGADGTWRWLSDRASVFARHEDGRVSRIIGSAIDINDSKESQQRLRGQLQFLQRLMDTIPNPLYYQDSRNRLMGCNKAFEQFFGRSRDSVAGHPLTDLCPPETANKLIHEDRELLARGGTQTFEARLLNGASKLRDVVLYRASFCSTEDDTSGIIGVMSDITDRRRMERELFKAEKLDSIGVLAGGIAHDFNNILVAILGNISLARMEVGEHEEVTEMLEAAEKATERARHLTHQLLTFSKGGAPIRKVANVGTILKETAQFTLRGSNVRGEFLIDENLKPSELDEGQFTQVINNLIINAVQAMPAGGTIEVRAENVRVGPMTSLPLNAGEYVRISFSDQGIGISPENTSRIFDPFFTTKNRGSGLGLASCYSIVKAHDGHIDVTSRLGVGSTFSVYLPATSKTAGDTSRDALEMPTGTGHILVMDDEEPLRRLTAQALKRLGYTAEVASDGSEAISKYRAARSGSTPFDLVILDLTVPGGMGGQAVLRELKRLDPDVKAIVASGYSNNPVLADFRLRGFCGRLVKPFRIPELATLLRDVLKTETHT
jgi:PAS domain S-box-containing protein